MQFDPSEMHFRPEYVGLPDGSLEHLFVAAVVQACRDPNAIASRVVHILNDLWSRFHYLDSSNRPHPPGPQFRPGDSPEEKRRLFKEYEIRLEEFNNRLQESLRVKEAARADAPPPEDTRQFLDRHHDIARRRGEEMTSVAEVFEDLLTYPSVETLLERVGMTSAQLKDALRLYFSGEDAGPPLPDAIRYGEVLSKLDLEAKDARDIAPTGFVIQISGTTTMRLGQYTLHLEHVFLSALVQFQQEFPDDPLGTDLPTERLMADIWRVLRERWPEEYPPGRVDSSGDLEGGNAPPMSDLWVLPSVQEFLTRHRQTARPRGHQFTTVVEVLDDLLTIPEVVAIVAEASHDAEDLRVRLRPLHQQT